MGGNLPAPPAHRGRIPLVQQKQTNRGHCREQAEGSVAVPRVRRVGREVRLLFECNLRKVNKADSAEGEDKTHPNGDDEAGQRQGTQRLPAGFRHGAVTRGHEGNFEAWSG